MYYLFLILGWPTLNSIRQNYVKIFYWYEKLTADLLEAKWIIPRSLQVVVIYFDNLLINPSNIFYILHLDHLQHIYYYQGHQLLRIFLFSIFMIILLLDKLLMKKYISLQNHPFPTKQLTSFLSWYIHPLLFFQD